MFEQLSGAGNISPSEYSPLVLAYMGDAVFELCARAKTVGESTAGVNVLNRKVRRLVNASSQAEMFHKIKDILSDKELSVLMRGRNAKSNTASKNAPLLDYRHATGLEALFGYLFLGGEYGRILELFNKCMSEDE